MSGGSHGMSCISLESAIEGASRDHILAAIMTPGVNPRAVSRNFRLDCLREEDGGRSESCHAPSEERGKKRLKDWVQTFEFGHPFHGVFPQRLAISSREGFGGLCSHMS